MLLKRNCLLYKWGKIRASVCWETSASLGISTSGKSNHSASISHHDHLHWTPCCVQTPPTVASVAPDAAPSLFWKWPHSSFSFPALFDSVAQVRARARRTMWRIESRLSRSRSRQTQKLWRWQKRLQFLGSLPIQLMVLVSFKWLYMWLSSPAVDYNLQLKSAVIIKKYVSN